MYLQLPIEEGLIDKGVDRSTVFLVADLTAGGNVLSSNIVYLSPTVEVHLPAAALKTDVAKNADGYSLRITSPVLARSVYANLEGLDFDISDNYFDILPGQTVEITLKTKASEDQVRSALKVRSLADAFDSTAATKPPTPGPPPGD